MKAGDSNVFELPESSDAQFSLVTCEEKKIMTRQLQPRAHSEEVYYIPG